MSLANLKPDFNEPLTPASGNCKFCRLWDFRPRGYKFHKHKWLQLTHDPFVVQSVQGVKVDLEGEPIQSEIPREYVMSTENKNCTNKIVAEHLSKGIIEKCNPCRGQFLSNIFLRLKPNGKHRLILDLSDLNDSVVYRHFKMESLQTAIDMVQRDCYLGSLDLSDAYYSIPVTKEDRILLRFKWGGGIVPVHMPGQRPCSGPKDVH